MSSARVLMMMIIMLVHFFITECQKTLPLESLNLNNIVLKRWRENWEYTISKMDSQSAYFYKKHRCTIADVKHIREHTDDVFSTWVSVFLKCRGLEERLLSVGVCDPYCRNGVRACEVIRYMDNVPIFRTKNIIDRDGWIHMVQIPVACHCKLKESYEKSEECSLDARSGLAFGLDR